MGDYDKLRNEISDEYHKAKKVTFDKAPQLESFARGVEEGLLKALILANKNRDNHG